MRWTAADPKLQHVAIACSGNFTSERSIQDLVPELHGNDVSVYSCMLGKFLAGEKVEAVPSAVTLGYVPWMEQYFDGGAGSIAAMMLGSNFFMALGKDSRYWERMVKGYEAQFERMHAKTVEKVNAITLRLKSFSVMDAREYLDTVIDHETPVVSFPPTYAGGYEKMFEALDEGLDWDRPEYEVLDEDGVDALLEQIADRPNWMFLLDRRSERWEPHHKATLQVTNRAKPVFIYSSDAKSAVVRPRQSTEVVPGKRLHAGQEIGDKMSLAVLSAAQLSALRSMYLNPRIAPAAPYLSVGVLVDGVLVGAFAIGPSNHHPTTAYLMSDFPVAPTDYPRLSKLIAMAALSRESQLLLQRRTGTQMMFLRTTAFTNNPVSMKYRGLLKLEKRMEAEDGEHKYALNYRANFGEWTLAEALATWKKKHGKRVER